MTWTALLPKARSKDISGYTYVFTKGLHSYAASVTFGLDWTSLFILHFVQQATDRIIVLSRGQLIWILNKFRTLLQTYLLHESYFGGFTKSTRSQVRPWFIHVR
jgi:hypothetical protein